MATRLKLAREWELGQQIDEGGFARVFLAQSPDHEPAVIKLVPRTPGAERELLFVEISGARNVIPIIDRGEFEDNWAIVMPKADLSLREWLATVSHPVDATSVVSILLDIAIALSDIDGTVVHRDLKPENILRLAGHWCLADFGISRYAEASTAADTRKFAMTPEYAAPERWRNERATIATDVYSLGVIAFEILNGSRPFQGPGVHDYREQHLHVDPPALQNQQRGLRTIVSECLYKAAGARPTPANLVARLQRFDNEPTVGGLARLQQAHLAEVTRRAESERVASQARSALELRRDLFRSAVEGGRVIRQMLFDAIVDAAPAVVTDVGKRGDGRLRLGKGEIEIFPTSPVEIDPWQWQDRPAFDVVAHAGIIVRVLDRHEYKGRSHSLWFCDGLIAGQYQWFETAFMLSPLLDKINPIRPFALEPSTEAAKAMWRGLAEFQLAWPFSPLDLGDLEDFSDRWMNWFAHAVDGSLSPPDTMPERETPRNWR